MNSYSNVVDFVVEGGIPNDSSRDVEWHNGKLLNKTLQNLSPGETLLINKSIHLMGGIIAIDLSNVTIQLDADLIFSSDISAWPRRSNHEVLECLQIINPVNLTLTSSRVGGGILNGHGEVWWNLPGLGYLIHAENRPRLLQIAKGKNVLLEKWLLLNSPYWTAWFDNMDGLEIRYTGISARRTNMEGHNILDLSALNTDGFDVSGRNIWIHDCNIWCQDDVIAVKGATDLSENMLFERVNASGLGFAIGSIGGSQKVKNITFRDSYLYKTYKGIYLKFRPSQKSSIEDVKIENIVMDQPQQWAIWIGPAQQSDTRNICYANPCSICWPILPGNSCEGIPGGTFRNITFQGVDINQPSQGGGVLLAHKTSPMVGVTFNDVKVNACAKLRDGGVAAAFPILPLAVKPDNYVILFCFILLAVLLLLSLVAAKIVSSRAFERFTHRSLSTKIAISTMLIDVLLLPLVAWIVYLKLSMGKPDSYYKCEGVIDGVATGGTWPVPSCFEDKTDQKPEDLKYNKCLVLVNPEEGVVIVVSVVFVIGVMIIGMAHCYEKRRAASESFTTVVSCCNIQNDETELIARPQCSTSDFDLDVSTCQFDCAGRDRLDTAATTITVESFNEDEQDEVYSVEVN